MLDAVTEEDLQAIVRQLIQKAREGDVAAARLVLSYSIGKPDRAVDPDTLDRQEWQTFQQGAVANQDFLGLLGQLQAPLACTILRALLPHLQQVVAQQLKEQLQEPVPAPEPEQGGRGEMNTPHPQPLSPAGRREKAGSEPEQEVSREEVAVKSRQAAARPSSQGKPTPKQTVKTERPTAAVGEAKAVRDDREFLESEESAWLDFLREVTGQDFGGQPGIGDQKGQSTPETDEEPSTNG